ncbi:hypothetical protein MASR2M44_18980 [Bacteroidota bacterium]
MKTYFSKVKISSGKLILLLLFVLLHIQSMGQCAMCKSNLESARANGMTDVGSSINMGILYLLALPYLIAMVFGFIYYKKYRTRKA